MLCSLGKLISTCLLQCVTCSFKMLKEVDSSSGRPQLEARTSIDVPKWNPLVSSSLKINSDVTYLASQRKMDLGVIIRNDKGSLLFTKAKSGCSDFSLAVECYIARLSPLYRA